MPDLPSRRRSRLGDSASALDPPQLIWFFRGFGSTFRSPVVLPPKLSGDRFSKVIHSPMEEPPSVGVAVMR